MGTPVGLKFALRDIFIGPDKATAVASGRIDGVVPVKEGPGIWQAGGSATPDQGPHDLSLNVGIDILNHLLAHIWRGGQLDTSFDGTDPDSPTASITMGVLAGFASQALLDTFPADAPLTIRLNALLRLSFGLWALIPQRSPSMWARFGSSWLPRTQMVKYATGVP